MDTAQVLRAWMNSPLADRSWMVEASCRGTSWPDLWHSTDADERAYAKAVCAHCPVRAECLQYALALGDVHGIWGGEGRTARQKILDKVHLQVAPDDARV